jgi:citrate lyase subunit beta/citryl-CoA lyase
MNRVNGILLGAEDLSSDMQFERTFVGDEILYPRAKIAYACAAYGIDAIDTPFVDVHNLDGLLKDSLRAKNLGMNAKSAIHPNQISIINKTFSPTQKQIENALKIELAAKSNKGVFSLDGKMVDKPIIERSKKILEKARKYDLL